MKRNSNGTFRKDWMKRLQKLAVKSNDLAIARQEGAAERAAIKAFEKRDRTQ